MNNPTGELETSWSVVGAYHTLSKHSFRRYADGPGGLDWANQPEPFRRFAGARFVELPLAARDATPPYDALFDSRPLPALQVDRESIGLLFEYSLALTAWKEYQGSRWALRANPSSGNLHPTEGYVVLPVIEGIGAAPAVYHYAPESHALEERTTFAPEIWRSLTSGLPPQAFLVGLTSIHWREAWKYGVRAYRYCQHDLGHALACLRIAAAALGWSACELGGVGDATLGRLLGVDRTDDVPVGDRETPGLLAAVWPAAPSTAHAAELPTQAVAAIAAGAWRGKANRLSRRHVAWPWIERVSAACVRPDAAQQTPSELPPPLASSVLRSASVSAAEIIVGRRSAQAMDSRGELSREALFAILARLMPRATPPWDAIAWAPAVSLGLFVHRVRDLVPGLYLLARRPEHEELFRAAVKDCAWRIPSGCPAELPLFQLAAADVRDLAGQVSCGQDIAADGVFSAAMLADWDSAAEQNAPWLYRRLYWETGLIGQMLYLEAEAAGLRGTGIGCFFDDAALAAFQLSDGPFRSLYHFTVGKPRDDQRLTTLPPYDRRRG